MGNLSKLPNKLPNNRMLAHRAIEESDHTAITDHRLEWLVFSPQLSVKETDRIVAYLNGKWGVY